MTYLHANYVMHRDMKPQNVLLGMDGHIKITDFGLAKPFSQDNMIWTAQTCTQMYKAPEVCIPRTSGSGTTMKTLPVKYNQAMDMWSVGCCFAEFLNRAPLFP
ncbi:hypothetical protein KIPB_012254, partial [Kipferlia bialata]|eukprot:g12254.t1